MKEKRRRPVTTRLSTYSSTAATGRTASTSPSTATTATRRTTARALTSGALASLVLIGVRLRLASELDGDLSLQDLLAAQLADGTLGFAGSREINEGVADGLVSTRVLGDGNRLPRKDKQKLLAECR